MSFIVYFWSFNTIIRYFAIIKYENFWDVTVANTRPGGPKHRKISYFYIDATKQD